MDINIAGRAYQIKNAEPSACDLAEVSGWCDYANRTIFLDPNMSAELRRDTLWHEIAHALFYEHGFPFPAEEEDLTIFLGRNLGAFAHENAAFVRKYLL